MSLESWRQDWRTTLRTLRRSPGFTLLTVVSTALGTGMATLAFGAVYAHFFRPLPFPAGDRLFSVSMERSEELAMPSRVSFAEFLDLGAQSHSFTAAAAYKTAGLTFFLHGAAERVPGVEVSGDFFRVLGIAPALGRALRPEDDRAQAPPVVVLGDVLWRRRFGGYPGIVGREVLIDEKPVRVIGVMPPGFAFPTRQVAWVPLVSSPGDRRGARDRRDLRDLRMMARLRPGVSPDEAWAEVRAIGRRLAARYPATTAGWRGYLRPLRSNFFSPETRLNVRYLAGASVFILLIAGANLLHLLLVQRVARRQEMAIRAAFGAGPWSAARRILTESALLAGTGGALGTAFAAFLLARLQKLAEQAGSPYWIRYDADLPVFLFALAATVAFALLLGLPAALGERRQDLSPVL
jgi:predicted permease